MLILSINSILVMNKALFNLEQENTFTGLNKRLNSDSEGTEFSRPQEANNLGSTAAEVTRSL